tara:strand:+ start:74 stop:514 length:441 start_codon:yes stop_codon:yes gene_type:complete
MRNTARGSYQVKNPEKYRGANNPTYRSSWELTFMMFCDNNPAVLEWASESVKIPYRDPLTGRNTVYVPDFLITYVDRHQRKHAELIEIKPTNQTVKEAVGKNPLNQAQYVKNMAKWEAANAWCKRYGMKFRIVNEGDIFHNPNKKR